MFGPCGSVVLHRLCSELDEVNSVKSVVVFDMDGLSIRSAGCYGNVETSTPTLNEFAAQARVFEQHYRAFVDSRRDRDAAIGSVVSVFDDVECQPLVLSDVEMESEYDVVRFDGISELTGVLEDRLDSDSSLAWVRVGSGDSVDDVDERFPLDLIAGLLEAGVVVVVTSCAPVRDSHEIDNEESIRTPLMIWSAEAARVQHLTTSSALDEILLGEADVAAEGVLVRSDEALALRDSTAMLVVTRDCVAALEGVEPDRLADAIDVTDQSFRLYGKPDDVWNVHNVLIEDVAVAAEMFGRLRKLL